MKNNVRFYLAVIFGAFIGGFARALMTEGVVGLLPALHPLWGLGVINALGCFGFALTQPFCQTTITKGFWLTGCWGAFTSFSAVALLTLLQTLNMVELIWMSLLSVTSWSLMYRLGGCVAKRYRRVL